MSKWFFSVSRMLTLVSCVASLSQAVLAGDFPVATRDDVLILTSKIQATQFLTHATFGATQAEIDALATQMRTNGTIVAAKAWIDAQFNAPFVDANSLHGPLERSMVIDDYAFGKLYDRAGNTVDTWTYVERVPGTVTTPLYTFNRTRYRQHAWWHRALAGQDQLRQKTAWALAQIIAVGENAVNFNEEEIEGTVTSGPTGRSRFMGLTNYYDIFARNAFGSYREVVGRVTYHAIMGDWLSFRGNRREQGGIFPDENYAREVMQLFTIGLDMLNDDGSPQTNAQGIIPTYDADDIREYAQVFTGLGYGYGTLLTTSTAYSPYSGAAGGLNATVKFQVPMRMAPAEHDRTSKVLLNGLTITNANGTNATHTEATANAEIDAALDGLFAHPSCPPFIVNRLIQRFVKSNPSKAYMTRVVNAFKNGYDGHAGRGNLRAVIKAVLLDPEAWQPIRVQYQRAPINKFVVTTMGTEDSRLQEPVLTYTRFTRFFKAVSEYQVGTAGTNINGNNLPFVYQSTLNNQFRLNSTDATFDQSPYTMPSVFNFYVSDYQSPGEITNYTSTTGRLQRGALFAPEFQIINAITSNNTGNFYRNIAVGSRNEAYLIQSTDTNFGILNRSTNYKRDQNSPITNVAQKSTRTSITYDFSVERLLVALATDSTYAQRQANVDLLLDRLDLYLCGGTLANPYKASLRSATVAEMNVATTGSATNTGLGTSDVTIAEQTNIIRGVVMAIFASPSFLVTE